MLELNMAVADLDVFAIGLDAHVVVEIGTISGFSHERTHYTCVRMWMRMNMAANTQSNIIRKSTQPWCCH